MKTMKEGDVIYENCPNCGEEQAEFERVADGSYWFACPECGYQIVDESEEGE